LIRDPPNKGPLRRPFPFGAQQQLRTLQRPLIPAAVTIEQPTAGASKRFENLDALRGICALFVALFHFPANGLLVRNALVGNAYLFVDYFFVLSGFVIAFSYGDRLLSRQISFARFLGLRLGRIYPLHLAVLAAFVLLQLLLFLPALSGLSDRPPFTGPYSPISLIHNIPLLHAFGVDPGLTWNGPSWSIAAEVWCYALFGLILAMRPSRPTTIAAMLSVGALVWLVARRGSIEVASDFGFVRCAYGFGLGFVTFQFFRKRPSNVGSAIEFAVLAIIAAFVSLASGRWTFAAPPLFAVSIYLFAGGRGWISALLKLRAFQFLGLVSYSIYMVHDLIEARFVQALRLFAPGLTARTSNGVVIHTSSWISDLLTVAVLTLVIAASYGSYRFVEKPGREVTRKWLMRSPNL
jgi:peptidoglycan/LPS O-acetylase OafA/YrhL